MRENTATVLCALAGGLAGSGMMYLGSLFETPGLMAVILAIPVGLFAQLTVLSALLPKVRRRWQSEAKRHVGASVPGP
jgi:hypothetical protein